MTLIRIDWGELKVGCCNIIPVSMIIGFIVLVAHVMNLFLLLTFGQFYTRRTHSFIRLAMSVPFINIDYILGNL